jgi:TP901 family phage tail tape measure protein
MAGDLNRSIKIYLDNSDAMTSASELETKIGELEKKLLDLRAAGEGNSKAAKKIERELTAQTQKMQKYKQEVADTERVLKNLSGATYNDLIKTKNKISTELKKVTRGTAEYNTKLEMLKRIQQEMRVEIGCQASVWGRATDFVNKYMGIIGTAVAAITGITLTFNKFREARNKLEESKADVKALTGLDDESIEWLTDQAKRLSTTVTEEGIRIRQSADEILEAYKLVGSAKPELLANKEALAEVTEQTLILASASGMKLTDAVDAVTLALNQYGDGADQAARYVNVLAAGSKFGAAAVESQTKAIKTSGVAAASAKIPIEQLVGTIETLGKKGIKDEIAGTGLKKFFLTLQTGADETNPKIVGLNTALENLRKKQMDATAIKKMFGEEGYNVASVLINEADKVEYYTKAVTGTSVALEQATIKSQSATAKMQQAKNKLNDLGIELMEKINPSIISVMNQTVNWTKKLVLMADWISKNTGLVITLISTLTLYTAAIKLNTYWKIASNGATLKATIIEKAHLVATRSSIAAEYALAAASALKARNIKAATMAMRSFLVTLGLNPIIAAGVAITALAVGIYKIWDNSTKSARALKEMNKEIANERAEAYTLFDALQRSNAGTKQRKELIDEINSRYGKYLENQLTEQSTTEDIAKALEIVNEKLHENIVLKTMQKEKEDVTTTALNKQIDLMDQMREKSNLGQFVTDAMLRDVKRITDEGIKNGRSWTKTYDDVISYIDYYYGARGKVDKDFWGSLQSYMTQTYQLASNLDKISQKYSPLLPKKTANELPEVEVIAPKIKKTDITPGLSAEQEKKITDAKLKEVDRYIATKKLKLTQDYTEGLRLYDDYQTKLQALELEKLNKQLAIYKIGSDERKKIEQLILDYKIKLLDKGYQAYLENLQKEKDINKKKEKQTKEHYDKLNELLQGFVKKEMDEKEKAREEEEEKKKKQFNIMKDFGSEAGMILGQALTDTETTFADAMHNILLLTLDTLRQIAVMAIAERTIKDIGSLGFLGLAKAAGEIALINVAFGALKGLIKKPSTSTANAGLNDSTTPQTGQRVVSDSTGWYNGGFTGNGGILEVAGPVHREEYVTPAWQLQDPVSMNHILALDAIRRQRTSTNPLPVNGFANGGYNGRSDEENVMVSSNNPELLKVLTQLLMLFSELRAKGMRAYIVYSDIEAAQKTLDKSKKIGGK